jgi:hypothetical protein
MGQSGWYGVRVRVAVQALEVDLGRGQVAIGVVVLGSNATVGRKSQARSVRVLIGVEQDVCAVVLVVTGGVSNGGTRMGAERNLLSRAAVGLQCEDVGASACLQIEKEICGCHGVCMGVMSWSWATFCMSSRGESHSGPELSPYRRNDSTHSSIYPIGQVPLYTPSYSTQRRCTLNSHTQLKYILCAIHTRPRRMLSCRKSNKPHLALSSSTQSAEEDGVSIDI